MRTATWREAEILRRFIAEDEPSKNYCGGVLEGVYLVAEMVAKLEQQLPHLMRLIFDRET